jgi:hypothetical protein
MKFVLHPWQILFLVLAGWINRKQQNAIEYLIVENRILRDKLGKRRVLLTDDQRRRLAVKCKMLGRKALAEICSIVTPEPIRRHILQQCQGAGRRRLVDFKRAGGRLRILSAVIPLDVIEKFWIASASPPDRRRSPLQNRIEIRNF